ncbi:MAG: hypothetical protein GSR73_04960 [Desulfurococcales archaeon]|nr:hypothetical protein [Desulfurococcales archaeon]
MLGRGVYLLRGPGMLRVVEGEGEVLGYPVSAGDSIVIPVGRGVLARFQEGSRASYTGRWEAVGPEVYDDWDRLASSLAKRDRILLVGPSDSGKSTLASWIANKLASTGSRVLYATVDIGQNENYCPGFTSSSVVEGPFIPGSGGRLYRVCFVGSFTPRDAVHRYIGCSSSILRGWTSPVVLDTDGWVSPWEGLESKVAVAEAADVDRVVAVGLEERYVEFLRKRLAGVEVTVIPPPYRGSKSREERRIHRERLVAKALAGARERSYSLDRVPLYGAPLFVGEPLDPKPFSEMLGSTVYYAERAGGGVRVVVRGRARSQPGVVFVRSGWERGLLVSLWHEGLGFPGLVTRVNYRARAIYVLTGFEGDPEYIEAGVARLDPDSFSGRARW